MDKFLVPLIQQSGVAGEIVNPQKIEEYLAKLQGGKNFVGTIRSIPEYCPIGEFQTIVEIIAQAIQQANKDRHAFTKFLVISSSIIYGNPFAGSVDVDKFVKPIKEKFPETIWGVLDSPIFDGQPKPPIDFWIPENYKDINEALAKIIKDFWDKISIP